ncbi:hypothetical protein KP509_20G004900 [Ceratopteris richardii]|uniref:Uncharacterized protein n=1 Tax=Ceratopteris richardii TaxID=49495 RepID=A0A8T2SG26_CERRI|nr:hypothetical protein KP509_20G004900 [Ceratopteris richardii]KAH7330841.1 hypothetical protein KP509_20G004900 [Ceratopteris richardii]KAH7330842.1 hypothetical protein KP509_20G004900 [Ceratopteris richardii]KAH7330843.1 hypothetical protein KP509_20G004900 [Ceratopteris richardii]
MLISSRKEGHEEEGEVPEISDGEESVSEEGKDDVGEDEDDAGAGAKDEERRLLDELEGLEEAEEEEYSGPLLAGEEDEDNDDADKVPEEEQEDHENIDVDVGIAEIAQRVAEGKIETDAAGAYVPAKHTFEGQEDCVNDAMQQEVLDFLQQPPELDSGTPEQRAQFAHEVERFFASRHMDYRPPKFYGENLNLLKLWRTVIRLGAYDYVTANKLWRQVGETFKPPKKCTTVSWSFRVFYERSLLEYERYMLRGTGFSSSHDNGNHPSTIEEPSGAGQSGSIQPQGRAKRDAAVRAMQGWYSKKFLENEDSEPAHAREKNSLHTFSKEKQINTGIKKRKNFSIAERASKTARLTNGSRAHVQEDIATRDENRSHDFQVHNSASEKHSAKYYHAKQTIKTNSQNHVNGSDIRVADEGPKAEWVKINVHRTVDCFEVYALVPGLLQEELRIQCEPGGLLVIIGEPEKLNNPWGVTSFKKVIQLPAPIDANSTSAVITLHGQLFVRVPYGQMNS